jgi:hypothetical protein
MTLPEFLLRYIENRWVWLGFRPPLPERRERFTLARGLVLTLGQTLAGTILGLGISLLLFQRIVAWPACLLGWFSAWQGIVGYGLTTFFWNRRAARLRADPGLEITPPPAPFSALRGFVGLVYFVLLAVIVPAAFVLAIENLRGDFLWRRERARLVEAGERLDFRSILGPAIPAEQNAGVAPIFLPLFDYACQRQGEENTTEWRNTNALHEFEDRVKLPYQLFPRKDKKTPATPAVDLAMWADAYRRLASEPRSDAPSWVADLKFSNNTNKPAEDVLTGVSMAKAPLAAICEASARPRSQFPVHYEEGFQALLRHLASMKAVNQQLELRCAAHLELGQTEAAQEDALCALRAAELAREEPLLISQLVRIAQGAIAMRTVWQGLAGHRWNDSQLASVQEQLAKMQYLPGLALAFEGERAAGIATMDKWIEAPRSTSNMIGPDESGGVSHLSTRLLPRAMLRQNQIALARYHSQMIATLQVALSNAPQSGLAAVAKQCSDTAAREKLQGERSPYRMIAALLAPATGKATSKAFRAETLARMATVACALERCRLARGVYPEKLEELSPAFLPQPPLDLMNRQPYHYHRTDDGWFEFYSVGLNGVDDQGALGSNRVEEQKDWRWPVPTRPEQTNLF